jgi:hypothetical protein
LTDASVSFSGDKQALKSEVDIKDVEGILDLVDGCDDLNSLGRDRDTVCDEKVNESSDSSSIYAVVNGLSLESGTKAEQVHDEGIGGLLEELVKSWLIWV